MNAGPASRRAPLLPLAGLGVVLLAGIVALLVTRGAVSANRWLDHSLRVQVNIVELGKEVSSYDASLRGYLLVATPEMRAGMATAARSIRTNLAALRGETADNVVQRASLARITHALQRRLNFGASLIAERDRVGVTRMDLITRQPAGLALIRSIADELRTMFVEEERLLRERQQRTQRLTAALALALAAMVFVVVVVAFLTLDDARKRYRSLREAHAQTRAAAEAAEVAARAREEAEAQLRQIQKMDSIGQLTGGIAHDFNNMLAVIIGSLDLAERRIDQPDRLARCLANARDGADRAAALVTRLLAFSRRQPLAPASIDVNRLVEQMTDLLTRTLGEQIVIATELAPEIWTVFADPVQLENAVVNLAVNARDAMPQGGRLTIRTRNATLDEDYVRRHPDVTAGEYVLLMVRDDGVGMEPDVLAHAVDPFFTTKSVGKGTGLGLSQVFGFVKQSGGHVGIDSAPGRGTSIRLFLPRSDVALRRPAGEATATPTVPGRGERVLVVEDDPRVRTFSMQALREIGYEPISAEDGAAALAIVRAGERIDLLFTDVVMPGMSGPELVTRALDTRPGLKVLLTSGYAREQVERGALAGDGVLPKPFTINQLAQRVREAIDRTG